MLTFGGLGGANDFALPNVGAGPAGIGPSSGSRFVAALGRASSASGERSPSSDRRLLSPTAGAGASTPFLVCFAITTVYLIRAPEPPFQLALLAEYFYGFTVSWRGAVVALAWGFFVGFVAGWFVAFCRNLTMATLLFVTRTRAELTATRTFLDHI